MGTRTVADWEGQSPLSLTEAVMARKQEVYVQCKLRSGNAETTAWLNRHGDFKVGSILTLKGQETRWTVLSKGSIQKMKDQLHTDWNVGGLHGKH